MFNFNFNFIILYAKDDSKSSRNVRRLVIKKIEFIDILLTIDLSSLKASKQVIF